MGILDDDDEVEILRAKLSDMPGDAHLWWEMALHTFGGQLLQPHRLNSLGGELALW